MEREYRIIRSARRTVSLEVTPECEIIVRAPQRMSDEAAAQFVRSHEAWLQKALVRAEKLAREHPEPSAEEQELLKKRAHELLPKRVSYFALIMGLQPTGFRITGAKTRFGSCSPRNSLCFSWRLMQWPDECIDYVVVHELAHIVHKNHGPEFYALVESVLPDYRQRIKLMKG